MHGVRQEMLIVQPVYVQLRQALQELQHQEQVTSQGASQVCAAPADLQIRLRSQTMQDREVFRRHRLNLQRPAQNAVLHLLIPASSQLRWQESVMIHTNCYTYFRFTFIYFTWLVKALSLC